MKTFRLLFSDAMARAIVSGRKTVTRRPVNVPPMVEPPGVREVRHNAWGVCHLGGRGCTDGDGRPVESFFALGHGRTGRVIPPPCAPGDILIGRECWAPNDGHEPFYRATDGEVGWRPLAGWRPSIHMPDTVARIRRRVVSVTVERVQDITEEDAVREGFEMGVVENYSTTARDNFSAAWESIYAAKGLGWDVNPWAWRIEFERENVQEVSNGR